MSIVFNNVSFNYNGNYILDNISLTIKDGEKVCIFTKSGEGASTIAKLCCGLLKPSNGLVLLNQLVANIQSLNVSLLLKNPLLFNNKTAYKNMTYVDKVQSRCIDEYKIKKILDEYEISSGLKPKKMSICLKLLLTFARADYANKNHIVADDIFSKLTENDFAIIYEKFINLIQNKTVLIISSKNYEFNEFVKYALVCGKLYKIPSRVEQTNIFSVRRLINKNEPYRVMQVLKNESETFLSDNSLKYKLSKNQQKYLIDNEIEKVYSILDEEDNIVAIFDFIGEEQIKS